MIDDGVVKYNLSFEEGFILNEDLPNEIEQIRERLFALGLIGAYDNGIGYGNISHRYNGSRGFIITGTQTGDKAVLKPRDYSFVESIDFETFTTYAKGQSQPSSEAITHGCIYDLDEGINAIIHVHNERLWQFMLKNDFLSTNDTPYGTPQMVQDVQEIYSSLDALSHNAFVMKGHFEGVVTFGKDLNEAEKTLYRILEKLLK